MLEDQEIGIPSLTSLSGEFRIVVETGLECDPVMLRCEL